jgi:hypothetical protein
VPADLSSPIPAALTRLAPTDPLELQDAEASHLLAYLAAVPDPRAARGRRHRLVAILAMAAAAVLAGARSIAAIAEWAADTPQPVRAALGARHHAPGTVVTTDALQTHPQAAEFLVTEKRARYLLVVKANQPTLLDPLPAPTLAPRPRAGPHPRPRPRPHRDPDPQGDLGQPVRVPPRRPGPAGHPKDPQP